MKHYIIFSLFVTTLFLTNANAQIKERTIDEIKSESIDRAKRGAYPLGGLDVKDVEQALSLIQSRDRDEWANRKALKVLGPPQLSRYDPPWTLPMFRRNEIMVEVAAP
jgi:hypothetical protein